MGHAVHSSSYFYLHSPRINETSGWKMKFIDFLFIYFIFVEGNKLTVEQYFFVLQLHLEGKLGQKLYCAALSWNIDGILLWKIYYVQRPEKDYWENLFEKLLKCFIKWNFYYIFPRHNCFTQNTNQEKISLMKIIISQIKIIGMDYPEGSHR